MKNIAAFFDIDGTIYREGLITDLFKKLITHELVDESQYVERVKPAFLKWNKRQGHYDDYLDKMIEIYYESLVGLKHDHIDLIAKKVVEQKGDRVYRFTRDQILLHQKNGTKVIAISGSPVELVKEMANKYNFDDYRGTVYLTDSEGRYTGKNIPMWDSQSKRKAIFEFVKKYDLDLDKCFAYGDTTGDLMMLSLVGHPYAINPTRSLLEKVKELPDLRKKIKVIVERKDMIYRIPIESIDTNYKIGD
ncbi:MAG: HAD-IB family hydrolase [Bacilli bacterium]|nr:HAD-IB family hydrolase [Bacilli bacterium]